MDDYYEAVERQSRYSERQMGLLAPLAAAGLASLAFEHESNRQLRRLTELISQLSRFVEDEEESDGQIQILVQGLESWISEHQRMRGLFSPLTSEDDREDVRRLRVEPTVRAVLRNSKWLLRNVDADVSVIGGDVLFPLGTLADWQALLQNVFANSSNAMLDSSIKRLRVTAGDLGGRKNFLCISDTGVGVDLPDADELFEPFVRRLSVSEERRSLGLGGTGLGLTIVRMICEVRNCGYKFVEPESGFSSTFQLTWVK